MLVQTISFFAARAVLRPPFLQNEQTFGTIVVGPDLTQVLTMTAPIANNNSFNNPTVANGTPQTLAPTLYANTNIFGALTIGAPPDPGLVEDALYLDDANSELLISPTDYLRIQE
jgi:hypothetical protein